MKGIRIQKNILPLSILFYLLLGMIPGNAFTFEKNLNVKGIYTVRADNRVEVSLDEGRSLYKPVYLTGVALDEHTLIMPLGYADDAENKQFLFYYTDMKLGLMALITRNKLHPVKLSNYKKSENNFVYHIVSLKYSMPCYGKLDVDNLKGDSVDFIFNEKWELDSIFKKTQIGLDDLKAFYKDYLKVIEDDGGVDEVFLKLSGPGESQEQGIASLQ